MFPFYETRFRDFFLIFGNRVFNRLSSARTTNKFLILPELFLVRSARMATKALSISFFVFHFFLRTIEDALSLFICFSYLFLSIFFQAIRWNIWSLCIYYFVFFFFNIFIYLRENIFLLVARMNE